MIVEGTGEMRIQERAAWVWDACDSSLFQWAIDQGVATVFVHVPWNVTQRPQVAKQLARTVAAAKGVGLQVQALGGEPDWVHFPERVVRDWLRPALEAAPFDAIHLDVEPMIDAASPDTAVIDNFVELIRSVGVTRPAGIRLEVDIRFWYHEVTAGGRDLTATLAQAVDVMTVMSYRRVLEGADGVLALATPTADRANAAGSRFRVGLETRDLGSSLTESKQTFHGAEPNELAASIATIEKNFAGYRKFAGVAVHDLHGWRALHTGKFAR